jgi:hypothetical protein
MSEIKVDETTRLEKKIRDLCGPETSHTMYRAANIMSEVLGTRVREQMLYNYRAKKLIKVTSTGRVTSDDLVVFITKRVNKKNEQK